MSRYFAISGQSLWNPSNGASRLLMGQVDVYQAVFPGYPGVQPSRFTEDAGRYPAVRLGVGA